MRLIDEARNLLATVDHTVHILVDGRLKSPRLYRTLFTTDTVEHALRMIEQQATKPD
ncbi:MAG TPA: hypothetical protein VHP83_13820 [Aggregatilineaceae bacterium]|nr:hypothetical protein [Aggregatilineaceae bacterium]